MSFELNFAHSFVYDTRQEGITLPVILRFGEVEVPLDAKVDTGASCCIFERQHAETLGIEIESGMAQKIATATGTFVTYAHDVALLVFDYEFDATVYFANDHTFRRNVLGRVGWLDRIRLGIIDYEGRMYISSYAE